MKPAEYCQSCVITAKTAYQADLEHLKGTQAAVGTVEAGRVVWLEQNPNDFESNDLRTCYAEGIGIIAIPSNHLQLAS